MRLSRPCYDKYRRCPGWAGGGGKYPKGPSRCNDGSITWPEDQRFWGWMFHRCNTCDVVVLPYNAQWFSPTVWRWRIGMKWDDYKYWRSRRR